MLKKIQVSLLRSLSSDLCTSCLYLSLDQGSKSCRYFSILQIFGHLSTIPKQFLCCKAGSHEVSAKECASPDPGRQEM